MTAQVYYPRVFFSNVTGAPLNAGKVYIGVANQDPQTHPVSCYWDADLTIPATQPITISGGYPVNNGARATIYLGVDAYSMTVRDKAGALIDYIPTSDSSQSSALVSVLDFGATGDGVTDDAAAIQAAIDSIPDTGGIVWFPRGTYKITSKLIIGDGSAAAPSTVQGVKLRGEGAWHYENIFASVGFPSTGATRIVWGSASASTMVEVRGPISSFEMEGILLDGNDVAAHCLDTYHICNSALTDVKMVNFTAIGWYHTAYKTPANTYIGACDNTFTRVRIHQSGVGGISCHTVGESAATPGNLDVARNSYHDCTFIAPDDATASAIVLQFCDLLSFHNCFFYSPGSGRAAPLRVVPPTGNTYFPSGIVFYNSPTIGTVVISGTWTPPDAPSWGNNSGIHFYPFTSDGIGTEPGGTYQGAGVYGWTHNGTWIGKHLKAQIGSTVTTSEQVVDKVVTDLTVANTLTQTDIYSKSIPGGLLGADGVLRLRITGEYKNNSGSTVGVQFRGYFGATLFFDSTSFTVTTGATPRSFEAIFEISARGGSAAQQTAKGAIELGAVGSSTGSAGAPATTLRATNAGLTLDSTAAQVLAVSVAHGTANSQISFIRHSATLELL